MSHAGHGDTSGSTTSSSSAHGMMVPYLHVAGGDSLFFAAWTPTSAGALAGAAIGLFLLAMLERYLAAVRGAFSMHWRQRARAMTAARDRALALKLDRSLGDSNEKVMTAQELSQDQTGGSTSSSAERKTTQSRNLSFVGRIPPFIASHDIPRGLLFGLQMLITYLLMLAVMTFQAAYIIGIVVGLGVGEILFGRITTVDASGGGH